MTVIWAICADSFFTLLRPNLRPVSTGVQDSQGLGKGSFSINEPSKLRKDYQAPMPGSAARREANAKLLGFRLQGFNWTDECANARGSGRLCFWSMPQLLFDGEGRG